MKTAVIIFCYSGDADLLPLCVASAARALPSSPFILIDDAVNPLPEDVLAGVRAAHPGKIAYKQSTWDRGGNLRGKQCIKGMLDEMIRAADATSAGIVVKLDCDTLLINAGWIEQFAQSQAMIAGSPRPGTWFSGICYALKSCLLPRLWCTCAGQIAPDACEDVVIGGLALALSSPHDPMTLPPQSEACPHGRWAAYNYQDDITPELYARRYDVLTVGNAALDGLPLSARVAPMRAIWEAVLQRDARGVSEAWPRIPSRKFIQFRQSA